MPAKQSAVTTPLHLLQQLSNSLMAHLQQACDEAQRDAELLLAKLEKQRGKTQEKVIKARARLDEAGAAGKSKAQAKARSRLAELDDMLALLQARQNETLTYLTELKRDAELSLKLAQGVAQVEQAASQALATRGKSSTRAKAPAKPSERKPAAARGASSTRAAQQTSQPAARQSRSRAKPASAAQAPAAVANETAGAMQRPTAEAKPSAATAKAAAPSRRAAGPKKPAARKPTTRSAPAASDA